MEARTYIDLFDDGITDFNFLIGDLQKNSFEKKLLDTIRFQVFLAILFDRQITVPECWMASSPLFLRVFNEVNKNYPTTVTRYDPGGGVDVLATYPFRFVFTENPGSDPATHFLRMISDRMINNRRMLWLPQGAEATNDTAKEIRKAASTTVNRLLDQNDRFSDYEAEKFIFDFNAGLIDIYGQDMDDKISALSVALGNIAKRLVSVPGRMAAGSWGDGGQSLHRATTQKTVRDVQNVVFEDAELFELFPTKIQAFRDFFDESEAKGKEFSDIMEMWEILKNYDPAVQQTAVAFGQLAMNQGYTASTNSPQGTLSFEFYNSNDVSNFTQLLLGKVVALQTNNDSSLTAAHFLETAPASQYDLADTIDWNGIWAVAAELAMNSDWRSERAAIEESILRPDDQDEFGIDEWNTLFDRINGRFQEIKFEMMGGAEHPTARILNAEFEKVPVMSKAKKVTGTLMTFALPGATNLLQGLNQQQTTAQLLGNIRKLRKYSSGRKKDKNDLIVASHRG